MTLFAVDLSKYQGPAAMDGFDGVILNVEDPTLQSKVDRARANGIPWDVYKWCYPGQNGGALLARSRQIVDGLHFDGRAPKHWLDYEEAGVTGNQVREWFDAGGDGWYCYLYLLNAQGNHAPDHPLWLAYYPSSSADWYPNYSDTARAKGAKIHQYTSTGGTLDRNVVLDEAWWAAWTSDQPTPLPPTPKIGAWNMAAVGHHWPDNAAPGPNDDWYAIDGGLLLHVFGGDRSTLGIPHEALDWTGAGIPITPLSDGDLDTLKKRSGWT